MIPYLSWQTIDLGPISLQVWGLFVALGFLLGGVAAGWFAKRQGEEAKVVYDLLPWLVLSGLVGGRLGHVLFYDFSYYLQQPLEIFAIWEGGLSVFGGLFLSTVVALAFFRRRQVNVWKYADILAFGLPFGKWLGRIGCFLIHDHPGTATDFVLGVQYPDGVVRHDHGLYLSLNALVMALVFLWLARKPRPTGFYLAVFSLWYGAVRFFLDFYRLEDARWLGLTPAQYFCLALFLFGLTVSVWISYKSRKTKATKLAGQE